MQRRARIKAVANLSSVRRGVSKGSTENQQNNEISSKKDEITEEINTDIQEKSSSLIDQISHDPSAEKESINQLSATSNTSDKKDDDVNRKENLLEKLNEKSDKFDKISVETQQNEVTIVVNSCNVDQIEKEPFKSPEHVQPRVEKKESSSSNSKFRKPKITPRLNISRAAQKAQESDEKTKINDVIVESINESTIKSPEKRPESPINVFSPPSAPFSPTPSNRARPETPREILDSPGLIINHNLHHPPTPQSPFHQISHSRIRTESLCSIKSTTVANLQPRKKVRTEDQKILDNKRESRERLSNKKIEKSQLRMFDMIYYNPTSNPMKPRAATSTKERSPKKIDLTMELPPPQSPSVAEEPSAMPVPQLRLNANGELVLDETSLVVENEEQKKNRLILANTNIVYHDELSGSYGYYKRQQRTKEWPQEETIKFFRCLNTVGTDFSLMLNLFPNRSRRDLKLKFKKEEKNNPHLVDKALLNHNTFDIEELQRELDEEDEIRRKEAESKKNSEVKELVKRKILKKQEAKAKARQQDKAKIEKILSDGDLVLNSVDNQAKENMEKDDGSAGTSKRKRGVKRKNVKIEPNMEFKKIVLSSKINSISVDEIASPISVHSTLDQELSNLNSIEAPVIIKSKPERKPIIFEEMSIESNNLIATKNEIEGNATIIDDLMPDPSSKCDQFDIENQDSLLSKTGKFLSDLITDSYRDTQENDYLMDEENMDTFECGLINVKKEEPTQKQTVQEIPNIQEIQPSSSNDPSTQFSSSSSIGTMSSEMCVEHQMSTDSSIEPQISTVESSSLSVIPNDSSNIHESISNQLSYSPSVIFVDSSNIHGTITINPSYDPSAMAIASSDQATVMLEPSYSPSAISVDSSNIHGTITINPSYDPSAIAIESSNIHGTITVNPSYDPSAIAIESSNIHGTITVEPSYTPSEIAIEPEQPLDSYEMEPSSPIDDESFLNSLDLERLAIVVKQIDGKDIYDIHETDGDSQPISDKPLNLPRHIVDLIVSAMTQDD